MTANSFILYSRQLKSLLLFYSRLKRTTDVMFGGKQVVVCGYGEVSVIVI